MEFDAPKVVPATSRRYEVWEKSVERTFTSALFDAQAFLIRGTLFKGALLCCLLVAVAGGLAIFVSQVNESL